MTYLIVMTCPIVNGMLFICAMKITATASYSAVPSMLTVAPMGTTKRVTRLSILLFSSRHLKVTGRVAALWNEEEKMEPRLAHEKQHLTGSNFHRVINFGFTHTHRCVNQHCILSTFLSSVKKPLSILLGWDLNPRPQLFQCLTNQGCCVLNVS